MSSGTSNFISDADLHGLVDGHIEAGRRSDALRRLAASPADRARVETWQDQNDLLRSAFAGIDREALPAILDLTAKPRLQCIPANDSPRIGAIPNAASAAQSARGGKTSLGFAVAAIILLAAGVVAAWMMFAPTDPDDTVVDARLRGSVDATLASRSTAAMSKLVPGPAPASLREGDRLPTTDIPDLRVAGFSFVSAEIEPSDPASILFRYQNNSKDRVVVSVAYAAPEDEQTAAPVRIGNAMSWRKRDHAFSIAGTLRLGRLRAIALALQNDPRN